MQQPWWHVLGKDLAVVMYLLCKIILLVCNEKQIFIFKPLSAEKKRKKGEEFYQPQVIVLIYFKNH